MALKEITMSELEQTDKGAVWVLNSALRSEYEIEGEILVNVPSSQGRPDLVKIPQSWLPFEMTSKFPKSRILDSVEFRSAVGKGLITVISEADAHAMLRQEGAKEERARLKAQDAHIKAAGSVRSIADANVSITNPNELNRTNGVPVETHGGADQPSLARQIAASNGQALDENGLKPNFVTFFNKMKLQQDMDALNSYRNKGRFSRRELRWMRDNLPAHPKTIKVIKSRLVELKKEALAAQG